jgi:glutamate-1-semialdehyde 2,1-aminomutase
MMTIFFTDLKVVRTYDDVKKCDVEKFNKYFEHMLKNGINIAPSQFEAIFLSAKHEENHIDKFLKTFEEFACNC